MRARWEIRVCSARRAEKGFRVETSTVAAILVFGGLVVIGLVGLFVVMPFIFQIASTAEAFNVLLEGIDEYFNRPGLGRTCCLAGCAGCIGMCLLGVVVVVIAVGCFTATPAAVCAIIGR
jgi:hypothetical protein